MLYEVITLQTLQHGADAEAHIQRDLLGHQQLEEGGQVGGTGAHQRFGTGQTTVLQKVGQSYNFV